MARGWESKSVESQIEEKREPSGKRKVKLSREEMERKRKRESLESTRRGLVSELERAKSEVLRSSLTKALEHVDEQLKGA